MPSQVPNPRDAGSSCGLLEREVLKPSSETLCSDVHQKCSDFHKVIQYIYHATYNLWQGLGNSFSDDKLFIPNEINKNYTDIPCFIVLHFILFPRYSIFYTLKICGKPTMSKSVGTIFQLDLLTLFVCHILAIFEIFQILSLLLYSLW